MEFLECTQCDLTFFSKLDHSLHVRIHKRKRKTYVLNEDNQAVDDDAGDHSTGHQGQSVMIKCTDCDRSFKAEKHLTLHIRAMHKRKPASKGNASNKNLLTKVSLSRRLGSKSSSTSTSTKTSRPNRAALSKDEKSRKTCEKSSSSSVSSNGKQKPKCMECGKRFTTRGHLKLHSQVHNKKTQADLSEHPETSTTVQTGFTCSICNQSFKTKASYNAHCSSHSSTMPCLCTVCNQVFPTIEELNEHIETH